MKTNQQPYLVLIYNRKHERKCCNRREEDYSGKYSRGSRNQNGEYLVNLFELNILEGQVTFPDLARNKFPVKSTSNKKINITYHRVMGDGCIWEETSPMNTC